MRSCYHSVCKELTIIFDLLYSFLFCCNGFISLEIRISWALINRVANFFAAIAPDILELLTLIIFVFLLCSIVFVVFLALVLAYFTAISFF